MSDFDVFAQHVREHSPRVFVVLGSGQGVIGERIANAVRLPFTEVPGLPTTRVAGHKGCLTLGTIAGVAVLVSEGRIHTYEGHGNESVVLTTRLAAGWGVRVALFTNAAGGIRGELEPGTLMPISSLAILGLVGKAPSIDQTIRLASGVCQRSGAGSVSDGKSCSTVADVSGSVAPLSPFLCAGRPTRQVLSPRLLGLWMRHRVWPGTYAMVSGPSYETPAEITMLRRMGVDAVGMSTAVEAVEAAAQGMEVAALSLITNKAAPVGHTLDHADVLSVARAGSERLFDLLEAVIAAI